MNLEKQILAYTQTAEKYANDNLLDSLKGENLTEEEVKHIVATTASILMTRDGVGYDGDEFVKAIVENKLQLALSVGTHLRIKCMKFMVMAKEWCAVSY